jgi:hypothetical protein
MFLALLGLSHAQALAPSPAPEGPSSDGKLEIYTFFYFLFFILKKKKLDE